MIPLFTSSINTSFTVVRSRSLYYVLIKSNYTSFIYFQAFTIQGDQVFTAPTFRYYSSNQDKAKFLKANVEEDIVSLTSEISELGQKFDSCRQDKYKLEMEIRTNKEQERRSETRLMKIREDKRKATMVQ